MKTLHDHIILYDAECPMCSFYTNAFVKTGMLSDSGRASYQESMNKSCPTIDMQRAVDEIALINTNTGTVLYGIDSLLKVIGHAFPAITHIFKFRPLVWLLKKLYAFISYNRRIIIPHDERSDTIAIQPTYRKKYRIVYLLITCLFTGFIISKYSFLIGDLLPASPSIREYLVCAGQVFFQAGVMAFVAPEKTPAYLGNMMTISVAGALILSPILILNSWIPLSSTFALAYFMLVVLLMLFEHLRRMRLLNLGYTLSISWILYRAIVLLIILGL
jgi:hypothetical protein